METAPGNFEKHVRDRTTSSPTEEKSKSNAEVVNAIARFLEEPSYRKRSEGIVCGKAPSQP